MGAPLGGFAAHVNWNPGRGWRVWVTSWEEHQTPARGHQATYDHLTIEEALDVLSAEAVTRCEWLQAPLFAVDDG